MVSAKEEVEQDAGAEQGQATVLVGTDFSPPSGAAIEEAIDLCKMIGARLLLLHAYEYGPMPGSDVPLEKSICRSREKLDAAVELARGAGVVADGEMVEGFPPDVLLDAIDRRRVAMAVLGTHGFRGWERMVFGSTAESVLRSAACPVVTVGPRASGRLKAHGVATGPVAFATDFHGITREAVRGALDLAKMLGVALHCLHVLPFSMEDTVERPLISQIMLQALRKLVEDMGVDAAHCEEVVLYGSEVSHAVIEYAEKHDVQMIVLGVRRASLVMSHLPPHLTYRIVMTACCPVMTWCYEQTTAGAYVNLTPDNVRVALHEKMAKPA